MGMAQVYELVETLPWAIREQIIAYVSAVNGAVPEIAREAKVELSARLRDDIIIIAAAKKLHAILATDRWAIDRMLTYLGTYDVATVTLGAQTISRGEREYIEAEEMLRELTAFFEASGVAEFITMRTYGEIATSLNIRYRES